MATVETIRKDVLCIVVGAHGAPASYRWEAVSFLTNDEDGSEARPPVKVSIPATKEDVAAHLSEAWVKVQEDIKADTARYAELRAAHDATVKERDAAVATLAAVRQALG